MINTKGNGDLKHEAHVLCDLIWGGLNSPFGDVAAQYSWLQQNTRTGHIKTLTRPELLAVIKKLKKKLGRQGTTIGKRWWE